MQAVKTGFGVDAMDRSRVLPVARDRVLLVDDEMDLQGLLLFNLRDAGFEIEAVGNGADALESALRSSPSVIVLDLMLPDVSGIEVCRRIRAHEQAADAAILMLTARGDEHDRVLGFEAGADDYVVKPFSVRELVMRVRGLATRSAERRAARASAQVSRVLRWRGLEIDAVYHRASRDGEDLALRPLEFKLLAHFLEHGRVVLSRAQLLRDVWGITGDAVATRTVDTHIRRLRERLGIYGDAIETVLGFGYRLAEE